jgi:hypothetical protein
MQFTQKIECHWKLSSSIPEMYGAKNVPVEVAKPIETFASERYFGLKATVIM